MSDEPIRDLLRRADEQAGAGPEGPEDLAPRVRRIAIRRRVARSGALVVLVFVSGLVVLMTAREHPPAQRPPEIAKEDPQAELARARDELARVQAELEELQAEIRVQRMTVDYLRELETARYYRKRAEEIEIPDPLEHIHEQLEQTAYTIIQQADRLEHSPGKTDAAAETYRRVITNFPQTSWAVVAKNRLSRLTKTGETL